ncbi:MAG: hypothetical protein MUD14_14560 [Hydrococcus sp. Prado102]|jgi:hypothetical protein|nr:hypothetical protein [Hydrococcus sp. Prado102]
MKARKTARELATQQRQQDEHRHESMLNRSQEALETASTSEIEKEARELMTEQRQEKEHLQASMRDRAETELHSTNS